MLFENERFNISCIYNVIKYAPKEYRRCVYPGKLPTYELMYFEWGEATVRFNGKVLHVAPRSVLFLPCGVENSEYEVEAQGEYSLYNIYFDTQDPLPREPVHISLKNDEIKSRYERIFRTWVGKGDGYYYKSMQISYDIIELLRRVQSKYESKDKHSYLTASEQYISEHYCDNGFDYGALVGLSGLSYSYFKKLFIGKYGCPPVKYVTRLRIERACELLESEKFSVCEIADICGFENVYYFSNVFKKQTGVSPKNYRAGKEAKN